MERRFSLPRQDREHSCRNSWSSQGTGRSSVCPSLPESYTAFLSHTKVSLFPPHPLIKCFSVTRNLRMCPLPPKATQTQQTPGQSSISGTSRPPPTHHLSGSEVRLTPDHKELHQHDWVEESQDKAEDVLMHDRRHQEYSQHGHLAGSHAQELVGRRENEPVCHSTFSKSPSLFNKSGKGGSQWKECGTWVQKGPHQSHLRLLF